MGSPPRKLIRVEDVTTVSLADLIQLKLHSGLSSPLRAQDIADVIGLIRRHKLRGDFAAKLDKSVGTEFRRLATAVRRERK